VTGGASRSGEAARGPEWAITLEVRRLLVAAPHRPSTREHTLFGIQGFELVVLGVLAMLLLGPDKLPRYAAEAARFVRQMRRMAANAQSEVRRELGPEFQDISIDDLNPRKFVSKHLLDDSLDDFKNLGLDDDEPLPSRRRSGATSLDKAPRGDGGSVPPAQRDGERPSYDADAT
jgi:sec-independent protein translocase protein TatB